MAAVERLYSQTFQVRIKSGAALEDHKSAINIAIELHSSSSSSSKRELKIQLTDDEDLFFLYSLTLGDEDFQILKSEQDLLVDFGAFPQKLIDLLHLCASEEEKPCPKYILELVKSKCRTPVSPTPSFASLKLIETNQFKNLEHLSLKVVAGTDADVKNYLAAKLKNVKETLTAETTAFSRRESELSERLRSTEDRLDATTNRLDDFKVQSQEEKTSLTSTLQRDLLAEKERVSAVRDECQRKADADRKALEADRQREKKQLEARSTNLEAANRELTDRRFSNEAALREFKAKVGALEEDLERASTELSTQRKTNVAVDNELRIKEKEAANALHKLSRCEEEIRDKEKVLQRSSELLAEERRKNGESEGSAVAAAAKEKKLEKYVKSLSDEVKKGNEIIKRLQDNLKSGDSKLKVRNQIAQEQEKTLQEKSEVLDSSKKEIELLKEQLEGKKGQVEKLQEEEERLAKELTEAKAKIEKDENLINWLNKQATEKHLQGAGGGGFAAGLRTSPYSNNNNNPQAANLNMNGVHSPTVLLSNGFGVRSLPPPPQSYPNYPAFDPPFGTSNRPPTAPASLGYPHQPATSTPAVATAFDRRVAPQPHPQPHPHPPHLTSPHPHPPFPQKMTTMPASAPLPLPVGGLDRGGGGGAKGREREDQDRNANRGSSKPGTVDANPRNGLLRGEGIDSIYLQSSKIAQNGVTSGGGGGGGSDRGPILSRAPIGSSAREMPIHVSAPRSALKKNTTPSSYFPKPKLNSVE